MKVLMHLSDLHRTASDYNSNIDLLACLERDFKRYKVSDNIDEINGIVITGDLIQGAKLGDPNAENEIKAQYSEAEEFISKLCDIFLAGNRDRLILVPGNHDVDWNISWASMQKLEAPPSDFVSQIRSQKSIYRWNWSDYSAYAIAEQQLYSQRLKYYHEFVGKFYAKSKAAKVHSNFRDWNLHMLTNEIAIVAFSSIDQNDCFNYVGNIRQQAISEAYFELRKYQPIKLCIAVWHHNLEGSPWANDYMDRSILPVMIDSGFQIGLHGHQHLSTTSAYTLSTGIDRSIILNGTGSLCASDKDLPHGHKRTYSVIQIDDDYSKLKIMNRVMEISGVFSKSHEEPVTFSISPSTLTDVEDSNLINAQNAYEKISKLETLYRSENWEAAVAFIQNNEDIESNDYGRHICLEVYFHLQMWDDIVNFICDPKDADEMHKLYRAYYEMKNYDRCEEITSKAEAEKIIDSSIARSLRGKIIIARSIQNAE